MKISEVKKIIGVAVVLLLAVSCSKENEVNDPELVVVQGRSSVIECEVNGASIVVPGDTYTYTYSNNFNASTITWSTTGSGITITGGQNTSTVTVQFSSQFSNGTLIGSGVNGNDNCAEEFSIVECTPPSSVEIDQDESPGDCPGAVIDFDADLFGGNVTTGSYQWRVFQGASIVSGQGTSSVRVLAPSSGGFSISVTFTSDCGNQTVSDLTLGQYDASCGGGGPSPF